MSIVARFECDGSGCCADHTITPGCEISYESLPVEWLEHEGDCYCPLCVEVIAGQFC